MTNRVQIHEFYKKGKHRKFLSFRPQFGKFCDLLEVDLLKLANKCKISEVFLSKYTS